MLFIFITTGQHDSNQ